MIICIDSEANFLANIEYRMHVMSLIRLWRALLRCTFFRSPVHRSINWSPKNPMVVESRLTQVRIFRTLFDLLFTHNEGNTKICGTRLLFKQRVIIQDWKYGQFINSLSGYSLSHCSTVPSCVRTTLQVCHMLRRVAAAMLFLVHLRYL